MSDKPSDMRLCLYPSDKNGCGMLRTIIPFNYMSAKLDWDVTCLYQFVFDLNLILRTTNYLRFQRQCTENQFTCIREYKKFIDQNKANTKLVYELDDLVHGIEPHNILAYQFYTPIRKQHVVDIMKMSEKVTFSTQFLKDFYLHNFGVTNAQVVPNYLPKFMWNPNFKDDKRPNKSKPVVIWGGSSSHVGPGGDLEFLLPMVEATMDEFEWTFIGVLPPRFFDPTNPQKLQSKYEGKISFYPWQPFYDFPGMMQSIRADVAIAPITDSVFNLAKSDLKYLEYAAMNIPSICSSIGNKKGPYDLVKAPNLVENDVDAWYQAIKDLSKDESKKQKTIEIQQQHVNGRWLENPENIEVYKKVYC